MVPEFVEPEQTERVEHQHLAVAARQEQAAAISEWFSDEDTAVTPPRREGAMFRAFWAMATFAVMAVAGCATTRAPAPQVEEVGSLTAGPSVYSAPLKHDAPPELGTIVDTGSDDVGAAVTTETHTEDAPEVTAKDQGIKMGGAR